ALASDEVDLTDLDARDVGDGVERPGRSLERYAERARPWRSVGAVGSCRCRARHYRRDQKPCRDAHDAPLLKPTRVLAPRGRDEPIPDRLARRWIFQREGGVVEWPRCRNTGFCSIAARRDI